MSAKPKEIVSTPTLEIINQARTDAWNETITPRLESLRGWTAGDEWAKGFLPYHQAALSRLLDQLVTGCKDRDEDMFVRGKIAAMKEIVGFRDMILRQIKAIEENKKKDESRGQAGY